MRAFRHFKTRLEACFKPLISKWLKDQFWRRPWWLTITSNNTIMYMWTFSQHAIHPESVGSIVGGKNVSSYISSSRYVNCHVCKWSINWHVMSFRKGLWNAYMRCSGLVGNNETSLYSHKYIFLCNIYQTHDWYPWTEFNPLMIFVSFTSCPLKCPISMYIFSKYMSKYSMVF